ncbi:MAG: ROK family transcriptional regulator [Spirochaetaceae bacterium]|nr:MAG: ROK family transcriptional regulator [Spirochaetaceae bacterium]
MLTKQSQVHVKENNLRLVLATIIQHEPLSRADIVRHTHISKPAISSLIDDLLARGIVSEIGEGQSSGGRKPILLRFNSDLRYFLAFEMGRTGFRVAVSDLKGSFVGEREGVFQATKGITERLALLKENILDLMAEIGIAEQDLLRIICIAPGIYVEKGKALKWTPNYQGAPVQDLSEFFRSEFKRDVIMNHSTKLSLLGEKIAGKARGFENVVYIDFAYGLGCAIMIDGKIHFGSEASAGEIGYFYSSLDEFRSSSVRPYQLGCLEQRISGKAIQDRAAEFVQKGGGGRIAELAAGTAECTSGKTVFEAYRLGDPEAERILNDAFSYFNLALCNIINLLAPELVILGGGFSRAGEMLVELVSREVRDRVLVMPRLEVSDLKNEASLIGGVHYLIDHTDLLAEL